MSRWLRTLAPLTVVALAVTACTSAASSSDDGNLSGKTVNVIGTWGGDEQEAFLKMVEPWEEQTGAKVKYTGTRDINTVLTTGVASGVLPDLAGLPGPGQMAEYAKAGALQPLDDVLDLATYQSDTAPALVELGKTDGKVYGVFIKAAVKGLIWYNPKLHDYSAEPAEDLDRPDEPGHGEPGRGQGDVVPGHRVRCRRPGWPATDWIEDLVLRTAGPDVYTQWYQGKVKWTDPAIKNGVPDVRQRRGRQDLRRRHDRGGDELRQRRRPALRRPARLRVPPPGELHHRVQPVQDAARPARTTTSSRSRTSTRSTPARSRAPATCSACSTTRRRRSR